MTDDLFDDFDLKSSADSRKEDDIELKEDFASKDFEEETNISSESMHPDIFPEEAEEFTQDEAALSDDEMRHLSEKIEAEKTAVNNVFSFSDEQKEPFDNAEEKFRYAVEEPAVEVRTIDKIRRSSVKIDPEHFGDTLRRLREAACVTTDALSEELRIKESFISALEHEDYDNLPPEVFVIAYIRKLGGVYRLSEDEIIALTSKVRERMEVEIPEDIDKVVTIYEPSEENESKLHHIVTFFTIISIVAVLLIGAGIYFFISSKKSDADTVKVPKNRPAERFSSDTVIDLQPKVKFQPLPLKINK